MALPYAIGAALLAANALTLHRSRLVAGLLYAVSALSIAYGIMLGLSLPLTLMVEGTCRPAPAPCPLGYAVPLSGRESFGLEAAIFCGALALVLVLIAIEIHYKPRLVLLRAPTLPPVEAPAPAPPAPAKEPGPEPEIKV